MAAEPGQRPAADGPAAFSRPKVAVVMAAHNAERTIGEAVRSILDNTEPSDLFIVDDCSRVPVASVIAADPRIRIIRLDRNLGPAGARNAALTDILAQPYPFVAIMDADDIAYPDRLAKQRSFLESHPAIGAVGAWARFIDEDDRSTILIYRPADNPCDTRQHALYNSPVLHPTAMIRADVLRDVGLYDPRFFAAEDYDLFRRIIKRHDVVNLPETLIDYRVSRRGQSLGRRQRQLFDRLGIQWVHAERGNWRAWAGMARTVAMMAMPVALIAAVKRFAHR